MYEENVAKRSEIISRSQSAIYCQRKEVIIFWDVSLNFWPELGINQGLVDSAGGKVDEKKRDPVDQEQRY